jgi:hypothetical protein
MKKMSQFSKKFLAMAIMAAEENIFTFCFHILKGLYIIDQRLKFHMWVTSQHVYIGPEAQQVKDS